MIVWEIWDGSEAESYYYTTRKEAEENFRYYTEYAILTKHWVITPTNRSTIVACLNGESWSMKSEIIVELGEAGEKWQG